MTAPAPGAHASGPARHPLSRRCAAAALVVYAAVGLTVVVPPSTPWSLLVLGGGAALGAGLRTGRATLVGAAVVLAVAARLGRAALLGRDGPGGGWGALVATLGLAAVVELARLAIDAGARRGPVRIAPEVRRRLAGDAALLAALATASAATVLALTDSRWGRPAAALLPLGLLALPTLLAVLTALAGRGGARPAGTAGPTTADVVADGGRSGSGPAPGRAGGARGPRPVALVVVLAALALPLLAGLGARTRGPFEEGAPAPERTEAVDGSATTAVAGPPPAGEEANEEDRRPPSPPLALLVGAGLVALLLALLLGGGEGLVSADDRRPDTAAAEEPLRGAPAAPVVEAVAPEAAAAIVDDALGYLRAELEPRLAVRCAYAAVAGGLGRHEAARRPAETELEFLARHLGPRATGDRGVGGLGAAIGDPAAGGNAGGAGRAGRAGGAGSTSVDRSAHEPSARAHDTRGHDASGHDASGHVARGHGASGRAAALARLTDLFALARFSDRPIDEAMRLEALSALEEIRRELQAPAPSGAAGRSAPRRPAAPAAGDRRSRR